MLRPERNVFEVVWETYKPTIAAVNGYAVGGGFELALACDIRIVSNNAKFGSLEVKRGMGATFASVMLPRLVPRGIALEMLYGGELYSAEDCAKWGLVNRLTEPGAALAEAETYVRSILENAPLTLRRYKEMATKGYELPVPTALRLGVGPDPYSSGDRLEGVTAFSDGRAPKWTGG
jgi:enoyl-CoA hydratase